MYSWSKANVISLTHLAAQESLFSNGVAGSQGGGLSGNSGGLGGHCGGLGGHGGGPGGHGGYGGGLEGPAHFVSGDYSQTCDTEQKCIFGPR